NYFYFILCSVLPVEWVESVFITQSHGDFFRCEFSEYTEWLIGTGDTEDVETERKIKDTSKFAPGRIGKNIVISKNSISLWLDHLFPVALSPLCPLKPNNVSEYSENSIQKKSPWLCVIKT